MSVPCLTIGILFALILFFVILRLVQVVTEQESHCETGCSKTIGSREVQEDFYQIVRSSEGLLAVLADGMGKELGGKIAARKVTEVFAELFQEYNALDHPFYFFQKAFQAANREILKLLRTAGEVQLQVPSCSEKAQSVESIPRCIMPLLEMSELQSCGMEN